MSSPIIMTHIISITLPAISVFFFIDNKKALLRAHTRLFRYSYTFYIMLRQLFRARRLLIQPAIYPLAQFFSHFKKRAAFGGNGYLVAGAGVIA